MGGISVRDQFRLLSPTIGGTWIKRREGGS